MLILQFLFHIPPLHISLRHSLHCSAVIQLSAPFIIPPFSPSQNYYFFDVLLVENKSIFLTINSSFGMGSHTWVVGATTFPQLALCIVARVCVRILFLAKCVSVHIKRMYPAEIRAECRMRKIRGRWIRWEETRAGVVRESEWGRMCVCVCVCERDSVCAQERERGLPSSSSRPPSPNVCDNLSLLLAWLTNYLQENEFFRHGFVLWE